jgi:hypothetical protein
VGGLFAHGVRWPCTKATSIRKKRKSDVVGGRALLIDAVDEDDHGQPMRQRGHRVTKDPVQLIRDVDLRPVRTDQPCSRGLLQTGQVPRESGKV